MRLVITSNNGISQSQKVDTVEVIEMSKTFRIVIDDVETKIVDKVNIKQIIIEP